MQRVTTINRLNSLRTVSATGLTGIVALLLFLLQSETVLGKSPLGQNWPTGQQVSMYAIDHSAFDRLLNKYVDHDGFVDYRTWYRQRADRQTLRGYLSELSRASVTKSAKRDAKLAFWINAYNAVTLEGIMQEYPTDSIRNHTARVFGYNIWKELPLIVAGRQYSLEQIEHQILRKMSEPRIHFAIVCASVSCPRLRNEAYTADKLQKQLAGNATDFFSRRNNFRISDGTMYVSSILNWFADDFGNSQATRFTYLQKYLPVSTRTIAVRPETQVHYLDYDWNLNDQSKRQQARAPRRPASRRQ